MRENLYVLLFSKADDVSLHLLPGVCPSVDLALDGKLFAADR